MVRLHLVYDTFGNDISEQDARAAANLSESGEKALSSDGIAKEADVRIEPAGWLEKHSSAELTEDPMIVLTWDEEDWNGGDYFDLFNNELDELERSMNQLINRGEDSSGVNMTLVVEK